MSFAKGRSAAGLCFLRLLRSGATPPYVPFGLQRVSSCQMVRARITGGTQGLALWVRLTHVLLSERALPACTCVFTYANCALFPFSLLRWRPRPGVDGLFWLSRAAARLPRHLCCLSLSLRP